MSEQSVRATLAVSRERHHCGYVSEEQLAAFRQVLEKAPGSIRELAEAAGVSHALLIRVRDGDRRLTPETVRSVVAALRRWGDQCHALANALEDATRDTEGYDAT